jgi:hypothetical protein
LRQGQRFRHQRNSELRLLEEIYPDAADIFDTELPSIEDIKDDCLVVLDANVLLFPYKDSKDNLEEITKVYRQLADTARLIVPAHVAREFVENRPSELANLYKELGDHKSQFLHDPKNLRLYPLLQSLPKFAELTQLESQIKQQIEGLRKQHSKVMRELLEEVRSWRWNDPVSRAYKSLFSKEVVFEPSIDRQKLIIEAKKRKDYAIPPGYKDLRGAKDSSTRERNLYGDLKIWFSILELARRGKNLIFVSGDGKPDWHHQSNGGSLYPRFELAEEYKRASGGKAFHILRLSELLMLYGANQETIKEVEQEEVKMESTFKPSIAQDAIANWWFDYTYDGRVEYRGRLKKALPDD